MTKLKNSLSELIGASLSEFNINLKRVRGGILVVVFGAVGIFELGEDRVGILTKKVRVSVVGSKLSLSVFGGGCVEIVGKVEDIELKYGKN